VLSSKPAYLLEGVARLVRRYQGRSQEFASDATKQGV